MTAAHARKWRRVLSRLSLEKFPIRVDVKIQWRSAWLLVVSLEALDVHTGKPVVVHVTDPAGDPDTIDPWHLVRRLLRFLLEHELDECLWVDGKHLVDPHAARKAS